MRRKWDKLLLACTAICVLCTIVVVAVVAPTVLDSAAQTNRVTSLSKDNCERIHRMYDTLDQLIFDGEKSLDAYLTDGTIDQRQYNREINRIAAQRAKLAGADCPPRISPPSRTP